MIDKEKSLTNNGYHIVHSPLVKDENNVYRMDFEDMEKKIMENHIHAAIFCSPHNPTGRVWEQWEIEKAMEIYKKHDVYVVSDEIWSDLLLNGHKHTPTQSVSEDAKQRTVALYAPSKTFNLAGLRTSIVVIPDESIRQKYMAQIRADEAAGLNLFGLPATEAAYTYGEDYLQELLAYIGANIQYAAEYIKENIPNVAVSRTEGTYFLWIDFRKTGLTPDEINRKLLEQAKVAGDLGGWFGKEGEGFIRLNLACPRSIVEEALKRIESVFGN